MAVTVFDGNFSFQQDSLARLGSRAHEKDKGVFDATAFKASPFMMKMSKIDEATDLKMSNRDKRRVETDPSFQPSDTDFSAPKSFKYDKTMNYYRTLGVDEYATQDEVKKAFKKLSLIYHPDKTHGMPKDVKEEYAHIFIEIKNASVTLSDNVTRRQYDRDRDRDLAAAEIEGWKVKERAQFDAEAVFAQKADHMRERKQKAPSQVVEHEIECRLEKIVYGGQKPVYRSIKVKDKTSTEGFSWQERTFRVELPRGARLPFEQDFKQKGNHHPEQRPDTLKFKVSDKEHELLSRKGRDLHLRMPVRSHGNLCEEPFLRIEAGGLRGRHLLLWGQNPFALERNDAGGRMAIRIHGEGVGPDGCLHLKLKHRRDEALAWHEQRHLTPWDESPEDARFRRFVERFDLLPEPQPAQLLIPAMQYRMLRKFSRVRYYEADVWPLGPPLLLHTKPPSTLTFFSGTWFNSESPAAASRTPNMFAVSLASTPCMRGRLDHQFQALKAEVVPILWASCFRVLMRDARAIALPILEPHIPMRRNHRRRRPRLFKVTKTGEKVVVYLGPWDPAFDEGDWSDEWHEVADESEGEDVGHDDGPGPVSEEHEEGEAPEGGEGDEELAEEAAEAEEAPMEEAPVEPEAETEAQQAQPEEAQDYDEWDEDGDWEEEEYMDGKPMSSLWRSLLPPEHMTRHQEQTEHFEFSDSSFRVPSSSSLEVWQRLAVEAFWAGDYWLAATYYERCLDTIDEEEGGKAAVPGEYARVLSNRAACFAKIGQYDVSRDLAEQATQLLPKWSRAWSRLGHANSMLGGDSVAQALKAYCKATELDPTEANIEELCKIVVQQLPGGEDEVRAAKEKGNAAMRLREWGEAIVQYTTALALMPDVKKDEKPPEGTTFTREELQERGRREQEAFLRAVLLSNRSAAFAHMRRWQSAVVDASAAVEAREDFPKGHCRLGLALLGDQRCEEAYHSFARCLRLDPSRNTIAERGRQECLTETLLWRSARSRKRHKRCFLDMRKSRGTSRIFALSDVHFDHLANEDWVYDIDDVAFQDDVLIVAGNLADSKLAIARGLNVLVSKFRRVFYTVGNDELSIHPAEEGKYPDSVAKLLGILEVCDELEVDVSPAAVCKGVYVVPLFSWYNAEFDEADPWPAILERPDPRCRWPVDADEQVWRYMLKLNTLGLSLPYHGTIITFSHFLPRRGLPFQERGKSAVKSVGCESIDNQLRAVGSTLHVYGHSGFRNSQEIDGVNYVHNGVGLPHERPHGDIGPCLMQVYDGWNTCAQPFDNEGTPLRKRL